MEMAPAFAGDINPSSGFPNRIEDEINSAADTRHPDFVRMIDGRAAMRNVCTRQ